MLCGCRKCCYVAVHPGRRVGGGRECCWPKLLGGPPTTSLLSQGSSDPTWSSLLKLWWGFRYFVRREQSELADMPDSATTAPPTMLLDKARGHTYFQSNFH